MNPRHVTLYPSFPHFILKSLIQLFRILLFLLEAVLNFPPELKCIQFDYHWLTLLSTLVGEMESIAETFFPKSPERHQPDWIAYAWDYKTI